MDTKLVIRLINDFTFCKLDWDLYTELFLQGPARANTLNEISGPFFVRVHWNLIENTFVRIARLTDPADGAKQRNLTLESLKNDGIDICGLADQYASVLDAAAKIRKYRHKLYAHRDLSVAEVQDSSTLLGKIVFNEITHCIALIEAFLNSYCIQRGFEKIKYKQTVDINELLKRFRRA